MWMRKKSAVLLTAAGILGGCQGLSQVSEPVGKRDHSYSKAFEACLDRPLEGRYTAAQLEGICVQEELDRLKRDIAHDWKIIEAEIRAELAQSKRVAFNRHRLDGLQKMKKLYQEMMTFLDYCAEAYGDLMGSRAYRFHYYGALIDGLHLYRRHLNIWWDKMR